MKVLCLSLCVLAVLAYSDARPTQKRGFFKRGGPGGKKGGNDWDDLLDLDKDDVADLAKAVSDDMGQDVSADDVGAFLKKHGKATKKLFYEVAAELDPEDFEEFEDLLEHPSLLGDLLDKLEEEGLLGGDKKRGLAKKWDELLDLDEDDVAALAQAVSADLGVEVSVQDVADFLEEYGETAEKLFYEVAAELDPEDFEEFEDLLEDPSLLGDLLDKLEEEGLLGGDKKKRGPGKKWDDLLDLDEDDVADLAKAVSDDMGQQVSADDVNGFLKKHGKATKKLFYEVAAELDPEDFEEFEDLLEHPSLLGDLLDKLEEEGLLGGDKKKRGLAKKWDELLDLDEDDVAALAQAVSADLGVEVSVQDVADFLEEYGETAEKLFYEVAAELDPEDFEEFEDLLEDPSLLGDLLDKLEEEGLLGGDKKKRGLAKKWDELLDLDEDDVAALAQAVSADLGVEVSVQDVADFLEEYGETAEKLFYEVAAELDPEDFEEFEDLLEDPSLLGDLLDKLEEEGLLGGDKKKRGPGKKWDDLLDLDEDDVADLAKAVSDDMGQQVSADDVNGFLKKHGKATKKLFNEVAAELDPEDFEEFEDLLEHPSLLGDLLDKLEEEGLLGGDKKKGL